MLKEYILNYSLDICDLNYNLTKFQNSNCDFEIISTGISYMKFAILPSVMKMECFNFALPSQDIYYDYNVFKYVLNNYYNKLKKLKFVIIGLCYYSFDYDMSKSKNKFLVSRYIDTLNLKENLNYDVYKLKCEIEYMEKIVETFTKDTLFFKGIEYYEKNIYKFWNRSMLMNEELKLANSNLAIKHSNKIYIKTEEQNMKILAEYIRLLKQNNIKPIIIIPPVSKYYYKYYDKNGINRFYGLLHNVMKSENLNIDIYDYFRLNIFEDKDFVDPTHLNISGANKFTQYLNKSNIFSS